MLLIVHYLVEEDVKFFSEEIAKHKESLVLDTSNEFRELVIISFVVSIVLW